MGLSQTPYESTIADFRTNRYDATSGILNYSAAQTEAFNQLVPHHGEFFATPDTRDGLRPSAITDPQQIKQLTAFFSWPAWSQLLLNEQQIHFAGHAKTCTRRIHCFARSMFANPLSVARGLTRRTLAIGLILNHL